MSPELEVEVKPIKDPRVLVIGDSCTDEFIYGQCDRLAPEGPVPVFKPITRVVNPGMAGNVVENLKAMGMYGPYLISNREEILKTRYVDDHTNHTIIRVDRGDRVQPMSDVELLLIESLIPSFDGVLVSDYDKGFLSRSTIAKIGEVADDAGVPAFIDTKKPLNEDWCFRYEAIKINAEEYSRVEKIGANLIDDIIITRGRAGAEYRGKTFPVEAVEVKDLSGAGDTFLAALMVEYLRSGNMDKSIVFANKMATIAVQKRGVSVV